MRMVYLVLFVIAAGLARGATAEAEIDDVELRQAADALAASIVVGGDGWQAYERLLHPEYSRWAMGQVYERREQFVDSLAEWWDYGMRVAARDIDLVAVDMSDDVAIIRFRTSETITGPDGPVDGFSGHVTNVWKREKGKWLLLSAEISSTARPD